MGAEAAFSLQLHKQLVQLQRQREEAATRPPAILLACLGLQNAHCTYLFKFRIAPQGSEARVAREPAPDPDLGFPELGQARWAPQSPG